MSSEKTSKNCTYTHVHNYIQQRRYKYTHALPDIATSECYRTVWRSLKRNLSVSKYLSNTNNSDIHYMDDQYIFMTLSDRRTLFDKILPPINHKKTVVCEKMALNRKLATYAKIVLNLSVFWKLRRSLWNSSICQRIKYPTSSLDGVNTQYQIS